MSAFSFNNLEGETIKGNPDPELLKEALQRFNDARSAMTGHNVDILEFPFGPNNQSRNAQDTVFIRFYKEELKYEIKVFQLGLYNARKLVGHFFLKEDNPERRYEMTVS